MNTLGRVRVLVGIIVGLCSLVAAYSLGGTTQEAPAVVRAHRFELVDADGHVRASLSKGPDVNRSQSNAVASAGLLQIVQQSPMITMFDSKQRRRLELYVPLAGGPTLIMYTENGLPSVILSGGLTVVRP